MTTEEKMMRLLKLRPGVQQQVTDWAAARVDRLDDVLDESLWCALSDFPLPFEAGYVPSVFRVYCRA